MSGFAFRFDVVLRKRHAAEQLRQRELAEVLRRKNSLVSHIRTMQHTISHSRRNLSDTLSGDVDMSRVAEFARYSGQVRQRAQSFVLALVELEKQIDVARQKLAAAARDRKALELLRDRDFASWQRDRLRRENREIDDTINRIYARRSLGIMT